MWLRARGMDSKADMPSVTIEDGVIHEIIITDPGSGYADDINYSIEEVAGTGGAGFGLDASIKDVRMLRMVWSWYILPIMDLATNTHPM